VKARRRCGVGREALAARRIKQMHGLGVPREADARADRRRSAAALASPVVSSRHFCVDSAMILSISASSSSSLVEKCW